MIKVTSIKVYDEDIYKNSSYNVLEGEKEIEEFESGRWTWSRVHQEAKINNWVYISPWELDFPDNQWNVFPKSVLSDFDYSKNLS